MRRTFIKNMSLVFLSLGIYSSMWAQDTENIVKSSDDQLCSSNQENDDYSDSDNSLESDIESFCEQYEAILRLVEKEPRSEIGLLVIGPEKSGKSTFCNFLLEAASRHACKIDFGPVDLKEYKIEDCLPELSLLAQKNPRMPVLTQMSLKDCHGRTCLKHSDLKKHRELDGFENESGTYRAKQYRNILNHDSAFDLKLIDSQGLKDGEVNIENLKKISEALKVGGSSIFHGIVLVLKLSDFLDCSFQESSYFLDLKKFLNQIRSENIIVAITHCSTNDQDPEVANSSNPRSEIAKKLNNFLGDNSVYFKNVFFFENLYMSLGRETIASLVRVEQNNCQNINRVVNLGKREKHYQCNMWEALRALHELKASTLLDLQKLEKSLKLPKSIHCSAYSSSNGYRSDRSGGLDVDGTFSNIRRGIGIGVIKIGGRVVHEVFDVWTQGNSEKHPSEHAYIFLKNVIENLERDELIFITSQDAPGNISAHKGFVNLLRNELGATKMNHNNLASRGAYLLVFRMGFGVLSEEHSGLDVNSVYKYYNHFFL